MFSANWFGKNGKFWYEWLHPFIGKPNLCFLEIGCFEGRATTWLLEHILTDKSSVIHTIDTFDGNMEHKVKGREFFENAEKNYYENIQPYADQVITHKGLSGEVLRELWGKVGGFDFVYIDGSHRSPEVLEDSILSWRFLKSGGIIIWDDYKWARFGNPILEPKLAIDSFLAIYKGQYDIIEQSYQVVIRKI